MNRKDLAKDFKAAVWQTQAEMEDFVRAAAPVEAADLKAWLKILMDRKVMADGRQEARVAVYGALAQSGLTTDLFAPFVEALRDGDALTRRLVVSLLPRVNDVASHGDLCKALGHADVHVRRAAAELLAQLGGPTALKYLATLVRERTFAGRNEAMEVMVPKAKHRAVDMLAGVLAAGTANEKLTALGHLIDDHMVAQAREAARDAVRTALRDANHMVAVRAHLALTRLATEDEFLEEFGEDLYRHDVEPVLIEALGGYQSTRILRILAERMRMGPTAARRAVVDAARNIANEDVIPLLVDGIRVRDMAVRQHTSEAILELGLARKIDLAKTVLMLLRSQDEEIRRVAAHLARSVGGDRADLVPQLLVYLRDEDWWVRERVIDALIELADGDISEHIVPYLQDPSPVFRRFAIGALIRLRDPGTLGAILRSAVDDEDWWVREQAVLAAGELGDERAIPYLHKLAKERADLRYSCIEALLLLEAQEPLLDLADLTYDEDPGVRLAMIRALGRISTGRQAAFYVSACINDKDERVAKAARAVLERWDLPPSEEIDAADLSLLDRLLVAVTRSGADDLILEAGRRPYIKHLGRVMPISKGVLSDEEARAMLMPLLASEQRRALERLEDVDLSHEVSGQGIRYRVNVFGQNTGIGAVMRRVQTKVPQLGDLGLPEEVMDLINVGSGLILVGGPTGSGKSTTLAAIIGHINQNRAEHIITIEDPIEILHPRQQSLINQREVGTHTRTFADALRVTLRQDPDIILVGEMRDIDTIRFAVTAAETGHLVFATVHTASAPTSVDRIVHAFPPAQQPQVRSMLADSLRAVLCQQLLRRLDEPDKRILAAELLVVTPAVTNLIRKDKCFQLGSVMATGRDHGMRLLDAELDSFVRGGLVDPEEAVMKCNDKHGFVSRLLNDGYLPERYRAMTRGSSRPPPRPSAAPVADSAPPGAASPDLRTAYVTKPAPPPNSLRAPGMRAPSGQFPAASGGGQRSPAGATIPVRPLGPQQPAANPSRRPASFQPQRPAGKNDEDER